MQKIKVSKHILYFDLQGDPMYQNDSIWNVYFKPGLIRAFIYDFLCIQVTQHNDNISTQLTRVLGLINSFDSIDTIIQTINNNYTMVVVH